METQFYQFSTAWSQEDEVFVAKVLEFPSLSAQGETPQEALSELQGVVAFVIQDLKEEWEPVPEPISLRSFSGKLNLRMPESLHRELAAEAQEENISLNQLINLKLSVPLRKSIRRRVA